MLPKPLVIIHGPMGVGKTAVCRRVLERLDRAAWLDGDWCWTMHPWSFSERNRAMALSNIASSPSRCSIRRRCPATRSRNGFSIASPGDACSVRKATATRERASRRRRLCFFAYFPPYPSYITISSSGFLSVAWRSGLGKPFSGQPRKSSVVGSI